jgi:hypothetical protein
MQFLENVFNGSVGYFVSSFFDENKFGYSFKEPEEPKLLEKIGMDHIVEESTWDSNYIFHFTNSLMEELLVEQREVVVNCAHFCLQHGNFKSDCVAKFRKLVKKLSDREIEPGIFKRTF